MGMMMIASFVIAVIAATLLALRFEVFVLVPVTLIAAAAIIAVGHQPKMMMALTLLGTVVSLQIGYLVGWTIRAHLQRRMKDGSAQSQSNRMAVGTSRKQFRSTFQAGKALSQEKLVPK
jgi:membrane protein DedA with SNARE-associated domain